MNEEENPQTELSTVLADLKAAQTRLQVWIGHHHGYGWVLRDMSVQTNQPDEIRSLLRCDQWKAFEVSRLDFSTPEFQGFDPFLNGSGPDAMRLASAARAYLDRWQSEAGVRAARKQAEA